MNCFTNIVKNLRHDLEKYSADIPANWKVNATKSFVYGFTGWTIVSFSPQVGLIAGAVSATASLVHSAVTPIFTIFGPPSFGNEVLKAGFSFVATACIAACFRINIFPDLLENVLFQAGRLYFTDQNSRQNVAPVFVSAL